MSTTFKCYAKINILNPNNSINGTIAGFNFSYFNYIDLSAYGGSNYSIATSNTEIIQLFKDLNIEVEIKNNYIVLMSESIIPTDIPSFKNPSINLLLNNTILNPIDYNLFNILDVSVYGFNTTHLFVYSEQQLINELKDLFNTDVYILNNKIIIDKYILPVYDIPVYSNPIVSLISNGLPVTCNFNEITGIDLSFYGGNIVEVHSNADILNAFNDININVSISNCQITLLEYVGATQDINTCIAQTIYITGNTGNFCNSNNINYTELNELDFTPFGGTVMPVNSNLNIINIFNSLGYVVIIENCTIRVKNKPCETIPLNIVGRKYSIPVAVNDNIVTIIPKIPYSINLLSNDYDPQNLSIYLYSLNNVQVSIGTSVTLSNGTIVTLLSNTNISINVPSTVNSGLYLFTYIIKNSDGNTAEATVTYTVDNVINPMIDYIVFGCNMSATVNVIDNDTGPGNLSVVKINGISILPNDTIWIIPNSLSATLDLTAENITLTSVNEYYGMGNITYTVSNGGTMTDGLLEYNIDNSCDLCAEFLINFSDGGCGKTCWDTLTHNGNIVNNYMIKLKKPDGSFYILPSGLEFIIATGIYSSAGNNFNPNMCTPLAANTYTPYIVFSDFGNDIECSDLQFTSYPLSCNSGSCLLSYSGPGGISAQLEFDVEVSLNSQINIINFTPYTVPDGIVIVYNNNVIFHSGNSSTCPYISSASTPNSNYVNCLGCTYMTGVSSISQIVSVPYVSGINTAKIIIFGYACSTNTTAWNLTIEAICQ